MGIAELIKSTTNKNTTNARLLSQFSRRATSIAADAERSNDTAKKKRLEVIITNLDRDFGDVPTGAGIVGISAGMAPAVYERRKEMIMQADTELNALQAPAPDRSKQMEEAAKRDQKNYEKELKNLKEKVNQASAIIHSLNTILPTGSSLHQNPEIRQALSSVLDETSFDNLRTNVATLHNRVAVSQCFCQYSRHSLCDRHWRRKISLVCIKICHSTKPFIISVPLTYTFGEMREDWMSRYGEQEEVDIPDFWIPHQGSQNNHITKTGRFWEVGEDKVTIGDAFKAAGVHHNQPHLIDVVENEKDYVVALLEDNGVESGRPVDLLTKKRTCARDYICSMFCDKNVLQVLKLQDGEDVSEKGFDRRTFTPRTNSVYIKLEGKTSEPL
ncbi:hypothetical protein CPB86DRAFT_694259 [Serendipita vermifera]|nr:hypothetical protein CPB86DRAFT_694259 [Serendipita vermifera]